MATDVYLALLQSFPQNVRGFSTSVEVVGILVAFLISYLGYKAYKLTQDKKYEYFFYGFLLLGLNYLSHVVLNLLIRFGIARYFVERKFTIFIAPVFGVYYFFLIAVLLAYVSLAIVYSEVKQTKKVWLFYFWALVVGAYTFRDYVMFNIVSAIPLSYVVALTYEKYKEKRNKNMLYTVFAFIALFLFHILAVLEPAYTGGRLIRYAILLLGLILLFIPLSRILHGGKKK